MKTYKTVRGALVAIIIDAFVVNDDITNGDIATLYHGNAAKRILANFNVTPKENNEFGLKSKIDNIAS